MIQVLMTQDQAATDNAMARMLAVRGIQLHFCPPEAGEVLQRLRWRNYDAVVVQTQLRDLLCSVLVRQYEMQERRDRRLLLPRPQPLFFTVLPSHDGKLRQELLGSGYTDVLTLPYSEYRLSKMLLDHLVSTRTNFCSREDDLRVYYGGLLLEMGMPGHLQGFGYLVECMLYLSAEPEALHQVTKVLYPEVARRLNTSGTNLERSMRNAMENMLKYGDRRVIDKYLTPRFGTGTRTGTSLLLGGLLQYTLQHRDQIKCL